MNFLIKNNSGQTIASNIVDVRIMNQIVKCKVKVESVKCDATGKTRRQGVENNKHFSLFLTSGDSDLTNKIFGHYFKAFSLLAKEVIENIEDAKSKESQKTRRLKHNLINHNTNILQELYKLIPQDSFKAGSNHIDIIQNGIAKDIKKICLYLS